MKIIHTSDWHIGQTLYQYSREEEHEFFFKQLMEIVREEKPDVLLISGDIFHSATPSVVSQRVYYHALVELSKISDDLQIVVAAGNHDSSSRLEAPRELWHAFNVSVVGSLDFYRDMKREESELSYDASKLEIPVMRNGEIVGWILAVPFINPGNFPSVDENDSYSNRVFSFYNNLKEHLKKNPQYKDNHHIVAMGHLVISGIDYFSDDKIIGKMEALNSEVFASLSDIDYWALGHIHHPQFVNNLNNMRYSGSPFPLTFNEIYPHSVSVVDFDNHNVEVKIREVEPMIPLMDFPLKPKSYNEASSYEYVVFKLHEVLDNELFIRLHVKSELPLSEMENARIIDMFKDRKAKFCGIQLYLPEQQASDSQYSIKTLDDFRAMSPFELGCSVYLKKNNAEMPEEMKLMFKEVCDEVKKLSDEN